MGDPNEIRTDQGDLIIVTQSCDLEQRKVRLVAGCPIFPLAEFEAVNPAFARKGRWNEVLKGRIEGCICWPRRSRRRRIARLLWSISGRSSACPTITSWTMRSASALGGV